VLGYISVKILWFCGKIFLSVVKPQQSLISLKRDAAMVGHATVKYADYGRASSTDKAVISRTWKMPQREPRPGQGRLALVISEVCDEGYGAGELEYGAREARQGLWNDPQSPWEWRQCSDDIAEVTR